jgi:hypothetical protein
VVGNTTFPSNVGELRFAFVDKAVTITGGTLEIKFAS